MANGKIEFTIGGITFVGEGEAKWVTEQLDKILAKVPELMKIAPRKSQPKGGGEQVSPPMEKDSKIASKTLAAFLKEKKVGENQRKKFLATAIWLEASGKESISTGEVTKALKESRQKKLGNPSDLLNKNISKGFCEKEGKQFFVTQEGKASL